MLRVDFQEEWNIDRILDFGTLTQLEMDLKEKERSRATIEKYLRDVRSFIAYSGEGTKLTKDVVIRFKDHLKESYTDAASETQEETKAAKPEFSSNADMNGMKVNVHAKEGILKTFVWLLLFMQMQILL